MKTNYKQSQAAPHAKPIFTVSVALQKNKKQIENRTEK